MCYKSIEADVPEIWQAALRVKWHFSFYRLVGIKKRPIFAPAK